MHVQRMLKMSRDKQDTWKKSEGKLENLFAIFICQINDLVPTYFY